MRVCLASLSLALLALLEGTSAASSCATACAEAAAADTGCTDLECTCSSYTYQYLASECLELYCTTEEATEAVDEFEQDCASVSLTPTSATGVFTVSTSGSVLTATLGDEATTTTGGSETTQTTVTKASQESSTTKAASSTGLPISSGQTLAAWSALPFAVLASVSLMLLGPAM